MIICMCKPIQTNFQVSNFSKYWKKTSRIENFKAINLMVFKDNYIDRDRQALWTLLQKEQGQKSFSKMQMTLIKLN